MTDIPEVAVEEPSAEIVERVAATIYGKPHCDKHPCEGCDSERKEARMHLMAIAPIIRAQVAEEIRAIPVGDFRTYDCLPSDYANMGRAEMREKVAQIAERSGE
ncbi:hypothetical protein U6G28_08880 [Actinomycetaceae bacterium MB13-C1-2]|nr:hypothetical protein U6G28_08880 [Actinomycetaceae bacterium MB13-C1-2]